MTFGEKVKAERTKLGMSQDELAAKIGVTRRIIGSYENDKSRPRGMERYKKLAEALNVSSRTVSRWETGSNMPDISLLVELAEFYQVSIPEIIDGERKSEKVEQETKDTAIKMAEYSKN